MGWLDQVENDDLADADLDLAKNLRGNYGVSDDRAYSMAREYSATEVDSLLE